jgi:hypothetical protein
MWWKWAIAVVGAVLVFGVVLDVVIRLTLH